MPGRRCPIESPLDGDFATVGRLTPLVCTPNQTVVPPHWVGVVRPNNILREADTLSIGRVCCHRVTPLRCAVRHRSRVGLCGLGQSGRESRCDTSGRRGFGERFSGGM